MNPAEYVLSKTVSINIEMIRNDMLKIQKSQTGRMMTEKELENLVGCYIHLEGYTDLRSIYIVLRREYPGAFDRKSALELIRKVLKEERN